MRIGFLLLCSLFFISCATAPKSNFVRVPDLILSPTPWFSSIEGLKADRCHTQLSDLQEEVDRDLSATPISAGTKKDIEALSLKRLALQQKISDWFIEDKTLSPECALISFQIQQSLRNKEVQLATVFYQKKNKSQLNQPIAQNVFMNSTEQLLSNIYINQGVPATSLSDLKNGDVVITITQGTGPGVSVKNFSLLHKNENGSLAELLPLASSQWVRIPLEHTQSWLKQPQEQVFILRSRDELFAESLVQKALQKISGLSFLEKRQPAMEAQIPWSAISGWAWEDPEADPHFQTLFEWKNYQVLSHK